MSTVIGVQGGLQNPKPVTLAGAGRTSIFDAQSSPGSSVIAMNYCNNTAGAITVLLEFYDGSAYWPMDKRSVAANSRDIWQDSPIRLRANQSVHVTGNTGVTCYAVVVLDSARSQSA